jgi:hypothetical protein
MNQLNLMKIESYHDLDFMQREKVILALSKSETFFKTFFNHLPYARTKTECFNHLNNLHLDIYGIYMYSDYNTFQTVYSKFLKNK